MFDRPKSFRRALITSDISVCIRISFAAIGQRFVTSLSSLINELHSTLTHTLINDNKETAAADKKESPFAVNCFTCVRVYLTQLNVVVCTIEEHTLYILIFNREQRSSCLVAFSLFCQSFFTQSFSLFI